MGKWAEMAPEVTSTFTSCLSPRGGEFVFLTGAKCKRRITESSAYPPMIRRKRLINTWTLNSRKYTNKRVLKSAANSCSWMISCKYLVKTSFWEVKIKEEKSCGHLLLTRVQSSLKLNGRTLLSSSLLQWSLKCHSALWFESFVLPQWRHCGPHKPVNPSINQL